MARVKPGCHFGSAGPGEVIEVPEHRFALVPWCLERVEDGAAPEIESGSPAMLDSMAANRKKKRR